MNITDKIKSLFNKIDDSKKQEAASPDPERELNNKAERLSSIAARRKDAFDTYGINKPFTSTSTLVPGYESWWHTIDHYKTGDEKREEVTPIYKFTSKDTIEVVGAQISEYDRITMPGTGLRMSSPRRPVREIGLEEYKNMMAERQLLLQKKQSERAASQK